MNITMESSFSKNISQNLSDRPIERIRFATPQAERKYKSILIAQERKVKKSIRRKHVTSIRSDLQTRDNCSFDFSKKKIYSPKTFAKLNREKKKIVPEKKIEDPFIVGIGPIPSENSKIFENMSFVICYASESGNYALHTHECTGEERDWIVEPFFSKDHLLMQLTAGGGKVYQSLKRVPPKEYERTKLITNVPSLHPQRVYCLTAEIPAYSHRWVIRCCQKNKTLDPSKDEEIPVLDKVFERSCETCYQRVTSYKRSYKKSRLSILH